MNRLGVYFGPEVITVVETKGGHPINNIEIPQSLISATAGPEEKVPEEVKMVNLLKDELVKKKIEAKEAALILSGKDLIIRSFEMPVLSRAELNTALRFEVKKYIPFKIEDLVSDFQWVLDKSSNKIHVLFVGIRKGILEKYLSVLDKLSLTVTSIEYSAFSVLRLFRLAKVREKGIMAVVEIDLIKNDEVNFLILKNGFPLFNRDITDIGTLQQEDKDTKKTQSHAVLEKIKREMLISLEYYERKFIGKNPKKMLFIMNPEQHTHLLDLFKDVELEVQFMDFYKYIDKSITFSLPLVKAYTGSLLEIDVGIKINLLSLIKEKVTKKISLEQLDLYFLITRFKPHVRVAIGCLLVCIMVYLFGEFQKSPFKKELSNIMGMRPQVSTISPGSNYAALSDISSKYREKINTLDALVKKQLYLTELLDAIPRLIPKGMWLERLALEDKIKNNKKSLSWRVWSI
ncbi:MAG: pilus assembly protein PilM [Candidatus Omnitrophica bacterium]|nr:pilus assembly protein PilM [Candidatus Omnitrophota bacterium]